MAATMTMNRVIHHAVRRDLDRLRTALEQFPDGDTGRARDLARAYGYLREELTRHHHGEDTHIWPMLAGAGVDADLLEAMESEHEAMAAALADTDANMAALAASGSAADAESARTSLARTRGVVAQHLAHEEDELEPKIIPLMESAEWKAVEKQLRKASPQVAGSFFAWVTDGMSTEGRTYLRSTVPPPVVFVLSRGLGRRYNRDIAPVWR